MPSNIIILSDRIKELSNTLGTTNMQLEGAAVGFSAFGDFYSHNDLIFYAITDGTNYEVGSGQYQENTYNELVRYPFRSTNSDGLVSWAEGVKEIYVTYPATHAVYTASGLDVGYNTPQASGMAFWESEHILNYDSGMVWDSTNKRIGLNQSAPVYAIEIGGEPHASIVHASGFIADSSGIFFPSGNSVPSYSGGRQLEHFLRNELSSFTGTDAVFQLSGIVDEGLCFKQQAKGHVLAGPPSGCSDDAGPCSPEYPSFRYLTEEDIPSLSNLYVVPHNSPAMSGVAFWHDSGVLSYDPYFVYDTDTNFLGVNIVSPASTLDVGGSTNIRGNLTVSGNADVHGTLTYINSNTVTLGDKNLELGSLSGVAMGDDSLIDGGGITVLSTDSNKEWKWVNSTDAWTTAQKIDVSGIVGLQAGSGLTLRENSDGQLLLLDIDDMFDLIPNGGSPSYAISQDDKIVVSGVKGVTTTVSSDGTTHYLTIDPTALSGQLVSEITTAASPYNYWIASGDIGNGEAIVNYDHVYFSGGDNVETTYYASYLTGTNVLAIDASGYIAAPGSGIGLATSAYGPSGQFYLDDPANLTGGQVTESTIVAADQMLIWDDDEGIWKYITIEDLQDEIDTGSGGGDANEYSFKTIDINDTDSGFTWGTADVVADTTTDTVKLVAGANITLASDATNDAIRITAGVGSSDTADSGIIKVGTEFRMRPGWLHCGESSPSTLPWNTVAITPYRDGTTGETWYNAFGGDGVNWDNDFAIAIGRGALNAVKTCSYSIGIGNSAGNGAVGGHALIALGMSAGEAASDSRDMICMALNAGKDVSGCDYSTFIGYHAGYGAVESTEIVAIGKYVVQDALACDKSVMIGSEAGYETTGTNYTNMIGNKAGYQSLSCDYANMIGFEAGEDMADCNYVNVMGYQAGEDASGVSYSNFFGYQAGHLAKNLDESADHSYLNIMGYRAGFQSTNNNYTNMLGVQAGWTAISCDYSDMVGTNAGGFAENCDGSQMIGAWAGYQASGISYSIFLGYEAGKGAKSFDGINHSYANMIGYQAGLSSTGTNHTNMIGYQAGFTSMSSDLSEMMGTNAGNRALDCDGSQMIGAYAGTQASGWDSTVAVGYSVGAYATGVINSIMIGDHAGHQSHGTTEGIAIGHYAISRAAAMIAIGTAAGTAASTNSGVMIGWKAGYQSSNDDGIMIGSEAGLKSDYGVGGHASGIMIGARAGSYADFCGNLIALGKDAASYAKAASGVIIGHDAGYGAGTPLRTEGAFERGGSVNGAVFIGSGVGTYVENSDHITLIGSTAGSGVKNSSWIDAVGYAAGREMHNCSGIVAIGRSAGRQAGMDLAGNYQIGNVDCNFFGRFAGKGASDNHEVHYMGYKAGHEATGVWQQICIGSQAGLEMTGAQSGVFIGYKAGRGNKGVYNLSILANGTTQDMINKDTLSTQHSKFNIANVIAGDHSDGDTNLGSTFPYKKRVSIGVVDATPAATVQIKPADTATTQLRLSAFTSVGSQSDPMMISSSISRSYNGISGNTSNEVINEHGFLRLPMFTTKAALLQNTAGDHGGEIAIYFDGGSTGYMAFCDGTNWRLAHNNTAIV